jgi:hypothetical protein
MGQRAAIRPYTGTAPSMKKEGRLSTLLFGLVDISKKASWLVGRKIVYFPVRFDAVALNTLHVIVPNEHLVMKYPKYSGDGKKTSLKDCGLGV